MASEQEQVAPTESTHTRVGEDISTPPREVDTEWKKTLLVSGSIFLGLATIAGAYTFIEQQKMNRLPSVSEAIEEAESTIFSWETVNTTDGQNSEVDANAHPAKAFHILNDDPNDYRVHYTDTIKQDGVVWFERPTILGNLNIFQSQEPSYSTLNFQYIQIGTYKNEPILYVQLPCDGMCWENDIILLYGTKETGYKIIAQHSTYEESTDYLKLSFNVTVSTDETLVFSIFSKKEILVAGVSMTARMPVEFFANSLFNITNERDTGSYDIEFISDTPYGPVFRGYRKIKDGLTADVDYGLRLENGLLVTLSHSFDFMTDDRVPQIIWSDGQLNTEAYRTDGLSSCGGGGPEVLRVPVDNSDIAIAGKTVPDSGDVYRITNPKHPLIERVFEDKDVRNYYEYSHETKVTKTFQISRADFVKKNGVLIYSDPFGLQHVFTNTKYGPQAECAKPVVYLYPEKTSEIRVSLDALVTKSEPKYENGWLVTADPDGTLYTGDKTYNSLFWDGYGNGEYPIIEEGFVVKTADALPLMEEHLATMGFNKKEIHDFVEFWAPLMPNKPYTRFSWIGTQGMENLAKLSLEPYPDTLIRAFVDYEGLDTPITLSPQRIPTYKRTGYVVTEWGGLLRE